MAERKKAPAGRPLTLLWMVMALVVVGGFLTWLNVTSEPTTVVVVEDVEEDDDVDLPEGVMAVERDQLRDDVGGHLGQMVRVPDVPSTGRLGPGIFWGELGDPERQVPILVRMDPALAEAVEIQPGVSYTITGQIHRVSEEELDEWLEQGEFAGAGEHLQATFADYYIQASAVRPTRGGRGEQPTG